jgi:DNA-directed RNA polymerase specialized sigma24 family protein
VVAARRALDIRHKRWPLTLPGDILAEFPKTKPETDTALAECIRVTMSKFPEDRRRVLDLDLDGVHHDEIARQMGKSRRTIQYWLESMRNAMLRCVE